MDVDPAACTFEPVIAYGLSAMRLQSAALDAVVLLDKGADLFSMRCRRTDAEMLDRVPDAADVARRFLTSGAAGYGDCYLGGWPSLLPSRARWPGGSISAADCGEAATTPWRASEAIARGRRRLMCSARLRRSGLRVDRSFRFTRDGRGLIVEARATNDAPHTIEFNWTEHPTFGGELLDGGFELLLPACGVSDVCAITTTSRERLPRDRALGELRAHRVAPGEPDVFRTLRRLAEPWIAVFNGRLNVGVRLRWDGRVLPHAWYWQTARGGRRALAIEPSNSYETELAQTADGATLNLRLRSGESMRTRLCIELIDADDACRLRGRIATLDVAGRRLNDSAALVPSEVEAG